MSKRINVYVSTLCKGFAVGVYVDGQKELMCWFIILSDNSLEYYFQRIFLMGQKELMVHSPLAMGFADGVYVSGPKE